MSVFIDIHTHGRSEYSGHLSRISVLSLSPDYSGVLPRHCSIGIHPWHAGREDAGAALLQLRQQLSRPEVLAVGECGLDRSVDVPWNAQMDVFRAQAELSENLRLPLLIHSVRAHSTLTELRKLLHASVPWIVHGFTGGTDIAMQLIRAGCFISFGEAILKANSKALMSCAEIPDEHLFLETDESTVGIETIYSAAAELRSCSTAELKRIIERNVETCFGEMEF